MSSQGLRIIVKLNGSAHPELHATLSALPARERAERMRVLATVGMLSFAAGCGGPANASRGEQVGMQAAGSPHSDTVATHKTRAFIRRLGQSLESG